MTELDQDETEAVRWFNMGRELGEHEAEQKHNIAILKDLHFIKKAIANLSEDSKDPEKKPVTIWLLKLLIAVAIGSVTITMTMTKYIDHAVTSHIEVVKDTP